MIRNQPFLRLFSVVIIYSLCLTGPAFADGPTAQQKIDRITWSFETVAHALRVRRKIGGWMFMSGGAGLAAVSIAHWTDYALIPSTDTEARSRAAIWGFSSGATAATFLLFGGLSLGLSSPDEDWKGQVAAITGNTPEERLSGFETKFRDRMEREKNQRFRNSLLLTGTGLGMIIAGFFPKDPFYRGAFWFIGGAYAGLGVPGFFMKGFYEREWDAYQSWVGGGEALTVANAQRRAYGSGWKWGVLPSHDGAGALASFRF